MIKHDFFDEKQKKKNAEKVYVMIKQHFLL